MNIPFTDSEVIIVLLKYVFSRLREMKDRSIAHAYSRLHFSKKMTNNKKYPLEKVQVCALWLRPLILAKTNLRYESYISIGLVI